MTLREAIIARQIMPPEKGDRGERGARGEPGPRGPKGDPGDDGAPGRNGADGTPGRDGRSAAAGVDGVDGVDGKDGRDGRSVREASAKTLAPGQPATARYDPVAERLILGLPRGEDGKDGQPGARGRDGERGASGRDGTTRFVGGGGGGALAVSDEDGEAVIVQRIDFQGAGVTAAIVGGQATVTVPGAGPGGGADSHYVHTQGSPATDWTVPHNLSKFPALTIVDSAGSEVEGDVEHVSPNSLIIHFAVPFSGVAYAN